MSKNSKFDPNSCHWYEVSKENMNVEKQYTQYTTKMSLDIVANA